MKQVSPVIGQVEHLPAKVAAYFSREIKSGRLRAGEKLNSENDIANDLGVSRNVVREAVSQLRADGMIQARQGVGAFVMAPENCKVIRLDPHNLSTNQRELGRLFELRCILETEAAALASERISAGGLRKLRATLERMVGEERLKDGSVDADLAFHREIARATGNEYINLFIGYIGRQIRESIYLARRIRPIHSVVEVTVSEHTRIFDALAAADPRAAREAMRAHISGAARRVGASLPAQQKRKAIRLRVGRPS